MSPFRADAAAHPESLESRYADRVWLRTSAIALAIGVTLVACGSAYSEAQLPASNGDGGGADGGASDAAADAVPRDAPDDATVLEASFADVTQIAANETHAFVAYRDGVARCSADGSCERNALTSSGVRAIAVDAVGTLFVASDSAILRCGGAPFGCAAERAAIDAMKTVPAANLVVGDNVIAVELHQVDATSSDLSFDLELIAVSRSGPVVATFVRGDANQDTRVDISDALKILFYLFAGASSTCPDALDGDDSGDISLTDAIYLLRYLFQGGDTLPAPFPAVGADPTQDTLGCE